MNIAYIGDEICGVGHFTQNASLFGVTLVSDGFEDIAMLRATY